MGENSKKVGFRSFLISPRHPDDEKEITLTLSADNKLLHAPPHLEWLVRVIDYLNEE